MHKVNWKRESIEKKERKISLTRVHLKGIGSAMGMQPYKGGVGIKFRGH
jgi:hypothetical protein